MHEPDGEADDDHGDPGGQGVSAGPEPRGCAGYIRRKAVCAL